MNRWIPLHRNKPKLGQLVWLWDEKNGKRWIGGRRMVDSENWLWGNAYNSFWFDGEEWRGDLKIDDDYQPTHYKPIPKPLTII